MVYNLTLHILIHIQVKEYSFQDAVEMNVGREAIIDEHSHYPDHKEKTERSHFHVYRSIYPLSGL